MAFVVRRDSLGLVDRGRGAEPAGNHPESQIFEGAQQVVRVRVLDERSTSCAPASAGLARTAVRERALAAASITCLKHYASLRLAH
ncbi:MAG: hypothetical protein A2681_02470 [Candidatus Liptonbacteria bacterium RIFCSPHIGHO2_01_FULL_56_18b]|nr:MAG: hypothetical protein UY96_C0023G0010 [Parcubacteria group bacterium GW2011_GWB1_56_8]OGY97841.1 MAG: hypothetical protein A2681_02470 [Candidatus Liptonbacteria bacterium RIFCSPHIGHO2_01_FULL_56_18b]